MPTNVGYVEIWDLVINDALTLCDARIAVARIAARSMVTWSLFAGTLPKSLLTIAFRGLHPSPNSIHFLLMGLVESMLAVASI